MPFYVRLSAANEMELEIPCNAWRGATQLVTDSDNVSIISYTNKAICLPASTLSALGNGLKDWLLREGSIKLENPILEPVYTPIAKIAGFAFAVSITGNSANVSAPYHGEASV